MSARVMDQSKPFSWPDWCRQKVVLKQGSGARNNVQQHKYLLFHKEVIRVHFIFH